MANNSIGWFVKFGTCLQVYILSHWREEQGSIFSGENIAMKWSASMLQALASGLRHELSSLYRKPWSWVRILDKAWMFCMCMRLFYVCVVLCSGSGLATSWSPVQRVLVSVKIITKLRNQAYSSKWEQEERERKVMGTNLDIDAHHSEITDFTFSPSKQMLR
jgi:hypothetical protein